MKRVLLAIAALALIRSAPAAQSPASVKFEAIVALAEAKMKEFKVPGVRADLLFKLKRFDEAKQEFLKAADLTKNASQRALLLEKARSCQSA